MADSAQHRGLYWSATWPATLTLVFFLASFAVPPQSRAQTFKVIHTFHNGTGPQNPYGQLILGTADDLYGIAGGGKPRCFGLSGSCGTVFQMDTSGELDWTYRFNGPDGYEPYGGILRDAAGNLFGVTFFGGKHTTVYG